MKIRGANHSKKKGKNGLVRMAGSSLVEGWKKHKRHGSKSIKPGRSLDQTNVHGRRSRVVLCEKKFSSNPESSKRSIG